MKKIFTSIVIVTVVILAAFFVTNAITEDATINIGVFVAPISVFAAAIAALVILVAAIITIPKTDFYGFFAAAGLAGITAVSAVETVYTATATNFVISNFVAAIIITGFLTYLTVSQVKDLDVSEIRINKGEISILLVAGFAVIVFTMLLVIL